jgi:hypothetical protein
MPLAIRNLGEVVAATRTRAYRIGGSSWSGVSRPDAGMWTERMRRRGGDIVPERNGDPAVT